MERHRVWKRQWRYHSLERPFEVDIPFEIRPAVWPDIEVVSVSAQEFRRETHCYEVELVVDVGCARQVDFLVLGEPLTWDAFSCKLEVGTSGQDFVFLWHEEGKIRIHMYLDEEGYEIQGSETCLRGKRTREGERTVLVATKNGVSGSFEGRGQGFLISLTVYGLRTRKHSVEMGTEKGRVVYKGASYIIGTNWLSDEAYGKPDAYVLGACTLTNAERSPAPSGHASRGALGYTLTDSKSPLARSAFDVVCPDGYTIVSPPRVTEEFEWRHTPMGDMTRILNHENVWRGSRHCEFPQIVTGIPTLDAAYQVAADVLADACSDKYALPGEAGLWSAGAFQGEGMGFGVWRRDTMQILLRGGALWSPQVSKKTLQYVMQNGKDNAVDGIAAPVVSCWDYYLATHDVETIRGMWPSIRKQMQEAETYFEAYPPGTPYLMRFAQADAHASVKVYPRAPLNACPDGAGERFAFGKVYPSGRGDVKYGLMRAEYASANDAFPDTEAGGHALGTEIYFMDAYRAAARFAEMFGFAGEALKYKERYETLLETIRRAYWNADCGYFTSGPVGSAAFTAETWESCGQEAAILERFCVADEEQKKRILQVLEERILTEYGIPLMPGRKEKSHVTHAAWPVYYTGYAQCAAQMGNARLLMKLIAQQVRNAVFNRTFYEVLDTDTGLNWRWPGQTWHAMGYISMLAYGVFGMKLTERGISFQPCVPEELAGIRMENLHYCKMTLDISTKKADACRAQDVSGQGRGKCQMLLDEKPVEWIPWELVGRHAVELFVT